MHLPTAGHRRSDETAIIVPAFNEGSRIAAMLPAALAASGVSRILVVDDGSTDGTSDVARRIAGADPRFTLLRLARNHGKACAMLAGAEAAATPIVLFLDADLIRLRPSHIEALMQPVMLGTADMSIGVFQRGRWVTDLAHRFLPVLSGQRCLRWSLFADIEGLAHFRSGVEVALNLHALMRGYRVRPVPWQGVTHTIKPEKVGYARGAHLYLKMNQEIAGAVSRVLLSEMRSRQRRLTRSPQGPPGS